MKSLCMPMFFPPLVASPLRGRQFPQATRAVGAKHSGPTSGVPHKQFLWKERFTVLHVSLTHAFENCIS